VSFPAICDARNSVLLLVDLQERLVAAMPEGAREATLRNAAILAQAAGRLRIPTFVSEQYPKGLGATEACLKQQLGQQAARIEKTSFSCFEADGFLESLRGTNRKQVVLGGMEAHICVLQTAMGLQYAGFDVYVVEDATCSRNLDSRRIAMDRVRQAGIAVTNMESVVFEWLRDSRHPEFKAISALLR
jgi:nicotinamidase-related amidase